MEHLIDEYMRKKEIEEKENKAFINMLSGGNTYNKYSKLSHMINVGSNRYGLSDDLIEEIAKKYR